MVPNLMKTFLSALMFCAFGVQAFGAFFSNNYTNSQPNILVRTNANLKHVYVTGKISVTPQNLSGTSIDVSAGALFSKALTANTTFTFANATDGSRWSVILTNGASWTVTWPTVTWYNGFTPVMDTGAGAVNRFDFEQESGVVFGTWTGNTLIPGAIGVTSDGAGSTLSSGVKGYVTMPYAGYITGFSITAEGSSPSCTFDVWRTNGVTTLPTVSSTIMGTKPSLGSGNSVRSTAVSTWSTNFVAGDVFGFNLDSLTNATRITFILETRQ